MNIERGFIGQVISNHDKRKAEKAQARLAIERNQQYIIDADKAEIAEQIEAEELTKSKAIAEELRLKELQKEQDLIDYNASLKPRYSLEYGNYGIAPCAPYGTRSDALNPTERQDFFNSVRVPIASNKFIQLYKRGECYELETGEHEEPLFVSTSIFEAMRVITQLNLTMI